jgi:hypothetical protein
MDTYWRAFTQSNPTEFSPCFPKRPRQRSDLTVLLLLLSHLIDAPLRAAAFYWTRPCGGLTPILTPAAGCFWSTDEKLCMDLTQDQYWKKRRRLSWLEQLCLHWLSDRQVRARSLSRRWHRTIRFLGRIPSLRSRSCVPKTDSAIVRRAGAL